MDGGPDTVIDSLRFASCYVYSPCGAGTAGGLSRQLRALLKSGDADFMRMYAVRVRQQVADMSPLVGYLSASQVLVPIPGSAPRVPGSLQVSERLAEALIHAGLGQCVWSGLRRLRSVGRSAAAAPGWRPTVENHYDSFEVDAAGPLPRRIVLIDDVITKGRTLLAAAARFREACPHAEIRAFALMRTMAFLPRVERLLDPCVGEIRWRAGDARRLP